MYGFVRGQTHALHTIKIDEAIVEFMNAIGLNDDTFNVDAARTTFYHISGEMKKEGFNTERNFLPLKDKRKE